MTVPPKPHTVRPVRVLKMTLEMLKRKWGKEKNYKYICEQFKSMRQDSPARPPAQPITQPITHSLTLLTQDLTVQHVETPFSVEVYETHARIAMRMGDLSEFNQCQTQLFSLYLKSPQHKMNQEEFVSYKIIYFVVTENRNAMAKLLGELHPFIRYHYAASTPPPSTTLHYYC